MKVGIYARVSKAEASERSSSVPVQLADCRDKAETEGWEVVDEYPDEGISAWNIKKRRPEYERMLTDVEAGRIDTILVRETERLLRSQKDTVRIMDLADKGRLKLIACTLESDVNFGRARDEKEFRDRASSAEFYSKFLSEKIRATKGRQKVAVTYTGGGPAFGYTRTKDGPVINPEDAANIHDGVKRLAQGDTLYRLTAEWNDAGVRTANGARWQPTGVRRLLLGEHLTGANGYPPILDDVEAAIVRQHLGQRTQPQGGRPPGRKYVATTFVHCAECGTKLTAGAGRYRCRHGGGCGRVSIEATPLERLLLDSSVAYVVKHRPKKPDRKAEAQNTGPILLELRAVESQLSDITQALADGTLTVAVAGPAATKLEERRRTLTEQLARALPPAPREPIVEVTVKLRDGKAFIASAGLDADDFIERWEARELTGNEVENLRTFITTYVERVDVRRAERRGGKTFDPSRVSITWRSTTP